MKRLLLAGLIVVMLTPAALAEDLQLTKGTMQLSGSASFDIDMDMPDKGDSTTGFLLNVMPSVGYFLMDNLALTGDLIFGMGFGDLYEKFPKILGFGAGLNYYIPMESMAIHVGAALGMQFLIPEEGDTMKALIIQVPLGILFPLNAHLGLDVGVRIQYFMSLEDGGGSMLKVPIGYLGVQGFF